MSHPVLPSTTSPLAPARFGARRIDGGHLPILYQHGEISGMVPAQLWQLQIRDYPKLAQLLRWWGTHDDARIFENEDLGPRILSRPVVGPVLLKLKEIKDGFLNHVRPDRFDEKDQYNPMLDITALKDYALTVGGKTLALVRMNKQSKSSLNYYKQHYARLAFDADRPVYEIELLQSAFWNRKRGNTDFQGMLTGVTHTLLLNILERLPANAELVYTPASNRVNRMFERMLKGYGIPYTQYFSNDLYGRVRLTDRDYKDDYPVFYRFRVADLLPAAEQMKQQLAGVPFDPAAVSAVSHQLQGIKEPARLVRGAKFEASS